MEEKSTFGKFVQQKRKGLNLTQKELADALYVTESAVSKWERGISYPDITLVSSICEILNITEHELVTASEDFKQREIEGQAKKYRTILKTYKWVFLSIYGIALITCFICNITIYHTLSWFWIVLTSLCIAFSFTTVPILVEKNKGLWILASFYISLNLLFAACYFYVGGNWIWQTIVSVLFSMSMFFTPYVLDKVRISRFVNSNKALIYFSINTVLLYLMEFVILLASGESLSSYKAAFSITLYCLIFAWIMMLVIRYSRINALFKASICTFLVGILIYTCNSVINVMLGTGTSLLPQVNLTNWSSDLYINGNTTFIITLVLAFIGIILTIGGILQYNSKNNSKR